MQIPKGSLISFMANKVKKEGGINLAQGIPAFDPPKELLNILKSVIDQPIHQYAPGTGNINLVKALAAQYAEYNIHANNLILVNGATEAISLIYTYINNINTKPFASLAFDPVYESYKNLPKIFNNPFVVMPLDENHSVDFHKLEENIIAHNIKIIFIASPGNPLGKVWTKKEIDRLIQIVEKHNIYLIFDAVYSELYFEDKPYEPLNIISPNVFYVNAFSKKLSITGWRLGYLITHESHRSKILDIHDYIGLSSPSLLQQAVFEYLDQYNFGKEYCIELRKTLAENYNFLAQELKNIGFKILDAQGGYFVWCQLPDKLNDGFEFAIKLYENTKVACVPGIHFSENGKRFVRFNIAQQPEVLKEATNSIKDFLK